jgi:hypothetical protein
MPYTPKNVAKQLQYILSHVYSLLGNGLVKKFSEDRVLGKQSVARSRNNRTNVYSSLLGNNQRANGLARELSRDLFSMRPAPCSVPNNRTVKMFTIIGVFYGVRAEGLYEAVKVVCSQS